MPASLLIKDAQSPYNIGIVRESTTLTTASQQYWALRQVQVEAKIARFESTASTPDAELNWKKFCAGGFSFLDRLLRIASDRFEGPLRAQWNGNKHLARDAKRLFMADAIVEILIPFSHDPLQFVKLGPRSTAYETSTLKASDHTHFYELGKPYLGISWKSVCLFALTPSGQCVPLDTFYVDTPDGSRWSTDPVVPGVFASVAKEFGPNLKLIETQFAPFLSLLTRKRNLAREENALSRITNSVKVWDHLHLPEAQKIEILRAVELFERGDPAAPNGLLLTGPSGVGKSLLGKTIAETAGCNFQHLTPATLKLDHLGGSGRKVREIWEEARRNEPSILYLDECEGILGRRGAAETDIISTEIVQAFLSEWDGLDKSSRVWVIGATNRRDLLDDAILSRFGWEMQISLPSEENRILILQQELKDAGIEFPLSPELGPLTQGMSGRDLQELARAARRAAHPEIAGEEHLRAAIGKRRTGRNTQVSPQSRWVTLVIDPNTMNRLKLVCNLLRESDKWAAQGLSIPRALLLDGPSGTGKTEIARTLANESGLTFVAATTADVKANFLGHSGNRVKQLFDRARSNSPAILFLDELDIIAPNRSSVGGGDPLTDEIVGQLLQEIDGIQIHDSHVFLLAATNRPDAIDPAVRSRFEETLVIPLPDRNSRTRLISIFLGGKKLGFPLEDGAVLLADLSDGRGWSGRDLNNWIRSAEQKALIRALEAGGPEHYLIGLDDFD
ncbi:AAA family ATPase [Acidicapsa ligni]|uniref:AAA family ATPase n=1 Tax=Acidicapsa ligni TaxID=542300 RepID=UPI0021E04D0D|nr:AAA family ATPase [Acidicapsa ligni]